MLLNNDFVVEASAETAWTLLTDLERVATCLPGASLDGRDGDAYVGGVTIKVGPISANFRGTAQFAEQDDAAHSATITASGKDPKGQAAVTATIRARLEPEGPQRTRVLVDTELDISGRMAQFGRGAIADVSVRLMRQFADNLSVQITQETAEPGALGTAAAAPGAVPAGAAPRTVVPAAPASPGVDAFSLVGPVVLKRLGPGAAAFAFGVAVGWGWRGRRDRRWQRTDRLGELR
ncbi:MAG: carbon monoxide dehydrogenase subunit [Blastococcus sp.]|nr:carbon monoxide dehydrogenase subunit [Blastococcus sp.]